MSEENKIPPEEIPQEQPVNNESTDEIVLSPEPIADAEQEENSNQNPQIENMEVHKHPHHVTHKKKWGEYLLEFLMLFLAVFLGFVAENIREHGVERSREKEYMQSMIEDLKTDSAVLQLSITKLMPYHLMWMDSTVHLFEGDLTGKDRIIYQAFFLATAWTYNFHPTERTLSQLHSQGFHLIKNKNAVKAISQLEDQYKLYSQMTTYVNTLQNEIDVAAACFANRNTVDTITRITFQNFHNDPFVHLELKDVPQSAIIKIKNKEAFKAYLEKLNNYSYYTQAINSEHITLLNAVTITLNILKNEYHLENE